MPREADNDLLRQGVGQEDEKQLRQAVSSVVEDEVVLEDRRQLPKHQLLVADLALGVLYGADVIDAGPEIHRQSIGFVYFCTC